MANPKIKAKILNEGFDRQGRLKIAMWSDPVTIYERRDGTFYFISTGRRRGVSRRRDGTFYLATLEGED